MTKDLKMTTVENQMGVHSNGIDKELTCYFSNMQHFKKITVIMTDNIISGLIRL